MSGSGSKHESGAADDAPGAGAGSAREPVASEPAAIWLEDVDKRYGRSVALQGVSFQVAAGQTVGLIGANGAGKSTTLRIISGFLDADAGLVRVAGLDVMRARAEARAQVGYLPESVPLYRDMRVAEYLQFRARLKGLDRAEARARIAEVMARVGLEQRARWVIGRLSKGYCQRVGLADALLARPRILLLDEPTSGLDPMQVRELRELLGALAVEHTVLLSSHVLTEIEATCSRVVILHEGRVVADGTLAELRAQCGVPAPGSLEEVYLTVTAAARADGAEPRR